MLIEKPGCTFKNCRYCFDGNCISADKYNNCKLTDLHFEIAKLRVDLENAKAEVAREIFEEIEEIDEDTLSFQEFYSKIMKLKKKYTEDKT